MEVKSFKQKARKEGRCCENHEKRIKRENIKQILPHSKL